MSKRIPLFLLFIGLFLLNGNFAHAQSASKKDKALHYTSALHSKWVFYPKIQPYIPLHSALYDINNVNVDILNAGGLYFGFSLEKFYPNKPRGFRLEIDNLNRDLVFQRDQTNYYITESALSVSPVLQWKRNRLNKVIIPFIELGVRNQYTYYSTLFTSGQSSMSRGNASALLNNFRLFGTVNVGLERILFNKEVFKGREINLENWSVGVLFPLFNQANLFNNNQLINQAPFEFLSRSRFHEVILNITYTQALDVRRNTIPYTMSSDIYGKCAQKNNLFFNWVNPKKNQFGGIYFHALMYPLVDSVLIESPALQEPLMTRLTPGYTSYRLGYTFHFLGNFKKYINENNCLEINPSSPVFKAARYNFFLSSGLMHRQYMIDSARDRILMTDAEFSAGGRIGVHPASLFLFGGFTYQVPISHRLFLNAEEINDFNFSNLGNYYWFGGFSFRQLFSVRMNYHPNFYNLKPTPALIDQFSISIGIGI
jgi:hypothetical protein